MQENYSQLQMSLLFTVMKTIIYTVTLNTVQSTTLVMFRPAYCSHCSYYLTLLWLAYKLTYIIIQYYLNNALPFNQP